MKRLSERALWLVDRLYKLDKGSTWLGRYRHRREIATHLAELSVLKETATVPCVSRFLFSKDNDTRRVAQTAIGEILLGIAPTELLQLSEAFGWEYGWYVGPAWNSLTPSEVPYLANVHANDASVSILGLLSFHRSGYVREEAVKRLTQVTNGLELPYLLIRQNDWVKPVSSLAQMAVQSRLESDYIRHLADNISLVAHMPELGRNDVSSITDAVFTQLLNLKYDDRLRSLIQTGESVTVRRFVKRGFELPGGHHERLARYGIKSIDVVVRLWSARQLLSVAYDDHLIDSLLMDVFPPVRRVAYEAKAEREPVVAVEVWKQAALDRSSGIRELGRYQLRSFVDIDIHELYCSELINHPGNAYALAGLAECATEADIELFRNYLQHKLPSRRRIAIAGLARVLGNRIADELVVLLTDESPSVVRQAALFMEDFVYNIDGMRLFDVLRRSQSDAGRKTIVRLIYEMGKWKSLPWLVRSAGLDNELVREQASSYAYSWLVSNRVFTRPTESEQQEIVLAFDDVALDIPSTFQQQLREFLPFLQANKAMSQGSGGEQKP